jgi:hypothetical protein
MPGVNPGTFRHWVDLDIGDGDHDAVTFVPSRVKCAIRPSAPGAFDEQRVTHQVEMRYHPQLSLATRLTFIDRHDVTHRLHVKGIQDVDYQNRYLVLLCEEVLTS